jgi:hypothetical protein
VRLLRSSGSQAASVSLLPFKTSDTAIRDDVARIHVRLCSRGYAALLMGNRPLLAGGRQRDLGDRDGDALWLGGREIPLGGGCRAPGRHGELSALRRPPERVLARFRHLRKEPIQTVTANGGWHDRFEAAGGDVDVTGLRGAVEVVASSDPAK